MHLYSMEDFQKLNSPENMVVTQHSRRRFSERNIKISDIEEVIRTGEIIEYYPEDYPVPSCLILGISEKRRIHIVASIMDGMIYLITAYVPDPLQWDSDLKKRKEE